MKKAGKDKALFVARKVLAGLVFNMAKLEGNPHTYPEVQTLLEGITVGGHKISDQDQVLRIAEGWERLIQMVSDDVFRLDEEIAITLNVLVAKDEALMVGAFRTGMVGIQGTDYIPPPPEVLPEAFKRLVDETREGEIPRGAYRFFLGSARNQFFWDGNKRTGQLMMNGLLMSNEYLPVSIPAKRKLEYNEKMIHFYDTGNTKQMEAFLAECIPWPTPENGQDE